MSSVLALFVWLVLLVALLRFDPAREPETSAALWVPIIWLFIVASRLPSQWLGLVGGDSRIQAVEDGNPLDRAIFSILILLAFAILTSRSFGWGDFCSRNAALIVFLSFALLSVLWSDFPFITFKRWFRDLGNYVVILVILSDPRPLEAIRTVLRRVTYLLVPLSILLIKYYINLSRKYDPWSGNIEYTGAATSKNMLGALCLIGGIFLFWDILARWSERREGRNKQIILLNVVFLAMTFWLLRFAHSATSNVCLFLGCLIVALAHMNVGRRHPGLLKTLAPATFLLYLILAMGLGLNGEMAQSVGRNPNLTDRTQIWSVLLSADINPVLGTGYQSFFLGSRLQWFWQRAEHVTETHNGYIGVYLDLGLVGLFLLGVFLVASYSKICERLRPFSNLGSLSLALWTILLFYNVAEQSLEGGFLWIAFLMGAMVVPEKVGNQVLDIPVAPRPAAGFRPKASHPKWSSARRATDEGSSRHNLTPAVKNVDHWQLLRNGHRKSLN